jgi:hypothetical protein
MSNYLQGLGRTVSFNEETARRDAAAGLAAMAMPTFFGGQGDWVKAPPVVGGTALWKGKTFQQHHLPSGTGSSRE